MTGVKKKHRAVLILQGTPKVKKKVGASNVMRNRLSH